MCLTVSSVRQRARGTAETAPSLDRTHARPDVDMFLSELRALIELNPAVAKMRVRQKRNLELLDRELRPEGSRGPTPARLHEVGEDEDELEGREDGREHVARAHVLRRGHRQRLRGGIEARAVRLHFLRACPQTKTRRCHAVFFPKVRPRSLHIAAARP